MSGCNSCSLKAMFSFIEWSNEIYILPCRETCCCCNPLTANLVSSSTLADMVASTSWLSLAFLIGFINSQIVNSEWKRYLMGQLLRWASQGHDMFCTWSRSHGFKLQSGKTSVYFGLEPENYYIAMHQAPKGYCKSRRRVKKKMAEWLEQASQWHEMSCHNLKVMSSNPSRVELGVLSRLLLS